MSEQNVELVRQAYARYFGRGKESGLEVRGAVVDGHVWSLRGGKLVKLRMYQGTEEALEAARLSAPSP